MTPQDIIYNEAYKQSLAIGCSETIAQNAAVMALQKYKNNQFQTPSKLIVQCVTDAKKQRAKKKR